MRKALGSIPSVSMFGRVARACVRTRARACACTSARATGPLSRTLRANHPSISTPTAPHMCAHARRCQQRKQCHDTRRFQVDPARAGVAVTWFGSRHVALPCHSAVAPWLAHAPRESSQHWQTRTQLRPCALTPAYVSSESNATTQRGFRVGVARSGIALLDLVKALSPCIVTAEWRSG